MSPIVQEVLRSPGQPLDAATRAFIEPRFGHDFSHVRVHAATRAAQSAETVKARAYTVGHHVVLGDGHPPLQHNAGRHSMAHELAHVVQQARGGVVPALTASASHEQDARAAANAVTTGQRVIHVGTSTAVGLARQQDETTNPLRFPDEVIEMPWTGAKGKSSKQGYLRDLKFFWRKYVGTKTNPTPRAVHLSAKNMTLINNGLSPYVDDTWIKYHPQHASYKHDKLIHHHMGQGSRTVAIPETLHRAHNVLHQQRQTVGTPTTATKGLDPVPEDRTKINVREHSKKGPGRKRGRIRGPGISGKTPPKLGNIPPSSAMAGMSPEQLRPVSAAEKADIARLDPNTGIVRNNAPAGAHPGSPRINATSPHAAKPKPGKGMFKGVLGAVDPGMALEYFGKGYIDFGEFAPTGEHFVLSREHGFGTVSTRVSALPKDMRMLTPAEAEQTLKSGDEFVNRSGPVTSKLSPLLQSYGNYEWFELWRIENGRAVNTGCRTPSGTRRKKEWVESELRASWNGMSFECPMTKEDENPLA